MRRWRRRGGRRHGTGYRCQARLGYGLPGRGFNDHQPGRIETHAACLSNRLARLSNRTVGARDNSEEVSAGSAHLLDGQGGGHVTRHVANVSFCVSEPPKACQPEPIALRSMHPGYDAQQYTDHQGS